MTIALSFTLASSLLAGFLSALFSVFLLSHGKKTPGALSFVASESFFAFFSFGFFIQTLIPFPFSTASFSAALSVLVVLGGLLLAANASVFAPAWSKTKIGGLFGLLVIGVSLIALPFGIPVPGALAPFLQPSVQFYAALGFFVLLLFYHFFSLLIEGRGLEDPKERHASILLAISSAPLFFLSALVFGDPFPLLFALILFVRPLFLWYALLRYDLFGVILVSKDAIIAGTSTLLIGFIFSCAAFFAPELSLFLHTPSWVALVIALLLFAGLGILAFRRQREFDSMKYEFVNVVTHKFRTPFTAIKWATDNMKKDQTKDERVIFLKQIESAVDRLTELTGTLVGVAQMTDRYSYIFVAHSFREIVESVLDRQGYKAREKNIALNIMIDRELPSLVLDVKKIQFVVEVIFENALRYTPAGGRVDISVQRTGKGVLFAVRDTGMGIAKEDLSKLFRKFFRSREATKTDTEGMGLGLSLAKSIIEQHRGKIWAESPGLGKGTTFFIELFLKRL